MIKGIIIFIRDVILEIEPIAFYTKGGGGGGGVGGGGYKTGGGGASEVLPLKKGVGGRTSFSHAEGGGGGHKEVWGSFYSAA